MHPGCFVRVVFGLAGLLALASSARAQGCSSGTALGTVTVLSSSCSTGSLPRTTCRTLRVECPNLPPLEVRVRVTDPDPVLPVRGTVVFGTGGGGTDFYGERPGGPEVFQTLLAQGFRLVDRAWLGSWFDFGAGMRDQSCRYATLLTWVHQNVHTGGVFCATGNSGGSAEIGYALTSWGRGDILDVAVPSGGPPMSRLDYLCGALGQQWNTQCRALVPPGVSQCGAPGCVIGGTGPVCASCGPNPTAADLLAESILHPAAVLAYPRTRVHVVLGTMDCSSAVPAGILFAQAVTGERVLEYVPNTPHWVPTSAEGRAAILRAILGGSACRPGPATLAAPNWPEVGGVLDLQLHGPAGLGYLLALALHPAMLEVPPLGWLFLDAPVLVGIGTLDPTSGRASFPFPIPADPALAGLTVYAQALTGPCLTNLMRVQILP